MILKLSKCLSNTQMRLASSEPNKDVCLSSKGIHSQIHCVIDLIRSNSFLFD